MKKFQVYDKTTGKNRLIACDVISDEHFKNETEFNTFVKMHPSCFYMNKKIDKEGTVNAAFNNYIHDIFIDESRDVKQNYSFNFNPQDDNNLQEYYELKSKIKRYKELVSKFENEI